MSEAKQMDETAELYERPIQGDVSAAASRGLSSDCKLNPMLLLAILAGGREHPCDRCNWDRKECRGYPLADER